MNKESGTKEVSLAQWPTLCFDGIKIEREHRTGRFYLKRVISGLEQTYSKVNYETQTQQLMYVQLFKELAFAIGDGREYQIKIAFTREAGKTLIELTLVANVTLIHAKDTQVGESVADLPYEVPPDIREWQTSGTIWQRAPWGWQRTA